MLWIVQLEPTEEAGVSGAFAKPSDGLEPSTPSLPWRISACKAGWRGARFPPSFSCIDAVWPSVWLLLRGALSIPAEPLTCPQNLSQRDGRPSRVQSARADSPMWSLSLHRSV